MQAEQWENPYISDGLIFYLDGIHKGETSGSWTELISETAIAGTNVVPTSLGWQFNGSAHFNSTYVITGSSDITIEVCFKPTASGVFALFAINNNSQYNPIFYWSGTKITWLQRSNTYSYQFSVNTPYSVSLNLDRGVFNGVSQSKDSSTDYWGNSNLWIGKRNGSNAFTGEIYSIRIYNKKLTEQEQLSNFAIDNSRFELGITI